MINALMPNVTRRNDVHLLREAGEWEDHHQDGGKSAYSAPTDADYTRGSASKATMSPLQPCSRRVWWLQMQEAYEEYNKSAVESGKSRGHFMVDLCRPGHLTACLRNFQTAIDCREDNWDAQFGGSDSQVANKL